MKGLLAEPVGGETLRAFVVFAVLLVILFGIAGSLLVRDLSLQALARRVKLGEDEARRIADTVASLGRDEGGISFHRLAQKTAILRKLMLERLSERSYVQDVEVRDRFGGRLFYLDRGALEPTSPGIRSEPAPEPQTITVQLMRGTRPEGVVRVGILAQQSPEIRKLRESLRFRLLLATAVGVAVLVVGFLYVLHLIRKNRQLERSRLAAERRSYVGLLASGLAHEIRNPLNAMNMNLQMLEEELQVAGHQPGGEDFHELLSSTKAEIKRLERLANNFLAYARPAPPRFEAKDLNQVLREVASFLLADFRAKEVELDVDLEPMLPSVELDETQFKQALMNLLVNARQVLRPGQSVRLVSRAGSAGEAVVEVRDNGPGIAEEAREKIFEVFYSSRGGGTGLGLPIARQIVERHGGTIEVETREGAGTTFRIRLPRRHPVPSAPAAEGSAT